MSRADCLSKLYLKSFWNISKNNSLETHFDLNGLNQRLHEYASGSCKKYMSILFYITTNTELLLKNDLGLQPWWTNKDFYYYLWLFSTVIYLTRILKSRKKNTFSRNVIETPRIHINNFRLNGRWNGLMRWKSAFQSNGINQ